jgi:histidinol-phosphate/aromatic aminotransferase/cobyric acid decarboxylase-like protein
MRKVRGGGLAATMSERPNLAKMDEKQSKAFHGGAFWEALDPTYRNSGLSAIPADVLDAWFSPPDELLIEFQVELGSLIKTSPPTHSEGLERVIAEQRDLEPRSVFAAPGSSALIHLILQRILTGEDSVLVLEPTYSEYRFVVEKSVQARCHSFTLQADEAFAFDSHAWLSLVRERRPKVVVLVRPNNPTGTCMDIESLIGEVPAETTVIVDEAYLEYTSLTSAEGLACQYANLIVIKSLSKVFGFSGLRVAYAVAHPAFALEWRALAPPWFVSGPAQWFGCRVWEHLDYYREMWSRTELLRSRFVELLTRRPGWCLADCANWVLWQPVSERATPEILGCLARERIFVRDALLTSDSLPPGTLRIAIRTPEEQDRILEAIDRYL